MDSPVLVSKLFVPAPRAALVPRHDLINRLTEGLDRGLTLVCAPAGFGKTTLLSAWVERIDRPTAWLSLDEGDNDPARFLRCVIAALQTVAPTLADEWLTGLQSPQPPPEQSVLIGLLNEISALTDGLVLVLDDYHTVDATAVDEALTFLIEHLPAQLHLVISTRQDPDLPVARLRARGQLTELRAADLRFTPAEAADYLNSVMGLRLSPADIATLERRTEGWIAGLQLAALSMRGQPDPSSFIRSFAGDHRYIADYLVGEVLGRQPDEIRSFLLETAVLDRMTGSLCDAVTGQSNGTARLEALERGNFFVVALDDHRQWYRYHHLFAELLHAHLAEEQAAHVATLHQRASAWYEDNGSLADAIRHSLAADDFERAADLVERAAPAMQQIRQEGTVLGWFRALPEQVFVRRPVLSATYAGTLLATGQLEGVEARLFGAERWLETTSTTSGRSDLPSAGMVVVNEEEFRRLPGQIAVWRAGIAQVRGQSEDTVSYARQALELVGADDHLLRGAAAALIGLASWATGDLDAAYEMYAECIVRLHRVGNISDVIGCSITLADIRITQGRLREAMAIYEHGLQLASQQGGLMLRGAADMYVGISALHCEHGDVGAARQQLVRSHELGENAGLPQNPYRSRVAMARVREMAGDLAGAVELLDEAERVYANDFSPQVRPVAAMRTRVWIAQGNVRAAVGWARERRLSAQDDLSYLHEFEHVTLARVLLAQYLSDRAEPSTLVDAMALLERLLHAADAGGRAGSAIEVLLLQALAHQARGDVPAALAPLARALALGDSERYVRSFVDEGKPMAALLQAAAKNGIARGYARRLLTAFGAADDATPGKQDLIEPLSDRELDVLRLLRSDLGGPEIARQLMVSLNTMRSHTKNIYSKLAVNSRRAAVRRGEELELFSRPRSD